MSPITAPPAGIAVVKPDPIGIAYAVAAAVNVATAGVSVVKAAAGSGSPSSVSVGSSTHGNGERLCEILEGSRLSFCREPAPPLRADRRRSSRPPRRLP